jgi:hypothetical protein
VTDACNPSYSRGRDQKDCGLKPALGDPVSKKKIHHKKKRTGWSGSRCRPLGQTSALKKKGRRQLKGGVQRYASKDRKLQLESYNCSLVAVN